MLLRLSASIRIHLRLLSRCVRAVVPELTAASETKKALPRRQGPSMSFVQRRPALPQVGANNQAGNNATTVHR